MKIKTNYKEYLNEATKYEISVTQYVYCGGNFRNITPVKGQYAKVIRKGHDSLRLQFNIQLTDNRGELPVISDTIDINYNQIRNLKHISTHSYERIMNGQNLIFESSSIFMSLLKNIGFKNLYQTYDMSYFDYDGQSVTYLPSNKNALVPDNEKYTSKLRQNSKIGRILQKLNDKYSEKDIERYGNEFKAIFEMLNDKSNEKLKVVTGSNITFWYNENNYSPKGGTLNSSCMRNASVKDRVAFYSKYPNKIAMCILLDDEQKLLARAIIWKLDSPAGVIFMDRIYYVRPLHESILANYAKENNMETKLSGYNNRNTLQISLESYKTTDPLPYLDTFWYSHKINKFVSK